MHFYLNLSSLFKSFRLKSDGSWKEYDNTQYVNHDDYTTTSVDDILGLLKRNIILKIEGTDYHVDAESWRSGQQMETASYKLFGYREEFPSPPSRRQMDETLASGDDNKRNRLVLMANGMFRLLSEDAIFTQRPHPEIVARYGEAFGPGNGYVGPATIAPEYESTNNMTFNQFLKCWVDHVKYGSLDQRIGEDFPNIHDGSEVWRELESIKTDWSNLTKQWIQQ